MGSTRLLVLDFVREYFARWGHSPSQGEIANGLDLPRERVRKALRRLVASGALLKRPGERGLMLPEARDAALQVLAQLGWQVSADPLCPLLPPPRLRYSEVSPPPAPVPARPQAAAGGRPTEGR